MQITKNQAELLDLAEWAEEEGVELHGYEEAGKKRWQAQFRKDEDSLRLIFGSGATWREALAALRAQC